MEAIATDCATEPAAWSSKKQRSWRGFCWRAVAGFGGHPTTGDDSILLGEAVDSTLEGTNADSGADIG